MNKELEARFDDAMMDVYLRALNECDYKATRFLQMLHEHRGLETARILHASKVSCEQCTVQPCADALAFIQPETCQHAPVHPKDPRVGRANPEVF